jgi:LysR family glycine cleavage system transcriptional activator
MNASSKPPSRASLEAFAAAGRRQSFRDAALDLGVTPSAISHQVKVVEAWVGAPLFERGVRIVRLTQQGQALSAVLNAAFAAIDQALDTAQRANRASALKVATLPLFAGVWLAPRIAGFEAQHPELSLSIPTDPRVYDLLAGEADVAIRNVPAPSAGLYARKLIDLRATPLCASSLAQDFKTPQDLTSATLIGLSVGRAGWPDWLAAAGVPGLKPKRTLVVDTIPDAIDAAIQGRGVMLGLTPLIWDAPAAAELVAPFRTPPQEAGAYFIACRKERLTEPVIQSFIEWLTSAWRADAPRLKRLEKERLSDRR